MSHYNFFKTNPEVRNFQYKLNSAITLIRQNNALVARKVIEAIDAQQVKIGSFFDLTPEHYASMRRSFKREHKINLPASFPPGELTVRKIESVLEGIIYADKYIYLSSKKNVEEIASTLIHEVGHFLNSGIFDEESKFKAPKLASYSDEVRSFTAEKMFEKNGFCLTRSDIKKIHNTVSTLYPEFTGPEVDPDSLGYIYASYDWPLHESPWDNKG
ncbi:hypothetical protein [Legionella londiniensis]|uniref:IrrE N-terminal-like domain-containing protein n=1 Tax=Legionella londiniensis TaxID=45068 RepID=A0A0W0VP45_9GAMM|nr:hypothetical protein [Legionella londiniensis]KTD21852.1 hypothetical protein Llon_1017 [Legionella londiniensis]STX92665.1 Uncharacterised protein [Legionella londiniensis]